MSTRMLIDARHPEETRVAVVSGNRVEEFDYEAASKRQLKGNIYLAKVTRVEPSLQAAFVDYGGNRHGFLAFSEIHPDYYQIPVEDRKALLEEERAAQAEEGEEDLNEEAIVPEADGEPVAAEDAEDIDAEGEEEVGAEADENGEDTQTAAGAGDEDEIAEKIRFRRRLRSLRRRYKIQEVIKRRQIILVQVVKEERGNKGAALTTYLSLAGRHCVLMPNTAHGGGISRKIANAKDRKHLRSIMEGLEIPEGMGCIIRTAGLNRTKTEIKRDLDYLLRMWDDIRALTLKSIAPALTYEEGNLIKRSIRDLYDRSIDEVLVEGEEGYRSAKEFMKLLMPSHAKHVKHYTDKIPLFHRFQVEGQIDSMLDPVVTLKSGGYIVINPTEALVAIDVNSGRATKEHNIEETAYRTNLEAADEIGRQLRLRDMAGLIVIDFIDMESRGNNRKLERRMKEAVKGDRARIQLGRISMFGLLELSRQRLRPNLLEVSTGPCPHCEGTGLIRTTDSSALHVLRAVEEEALRGRAKALQVTVPKSVALYILNQKRASLRELEERYKLSIEVAVDEALIAPDYALVRVSTAPGEAAPAAVTQSDAGQVKGAPKDRAVEEPQEKAAQGGAAAPDEGGSDEDKPKRRRRRGRRGGRRRRGGGEAPMEVADTTSPGGAPEASSGKAAQPEPAAPEVEPAEAQTSGETEKPSPKKRRSRKPKAAAEASAAATKEGPKEKEEEEVKAEKPAAADAVDEKAAKKPAGRKRQARRPAKAKADASKAESAKDAKPGKPDGDGADTGPSQAAPTTPANEEPEAPKKPSRKRAAAPKEKAAGADAQASSPINGEEERGASNTGAVESPTETPKAQKKRGWWQRGLS